MWQVIAGTAPGRTSDRQITLFDGVGFRHRGFLGAALCPRPAGGDRPVQRLDIIADPDDPRDLFGMLTRAVQG
jgi:ornithine cyclodeaminase